MCEIAVFDPERVSTEIIHQTAARFNKEQGDGLGILAVENAGDSFNYSVYKSIKPHWTTFNDFLERNWDDAWRFVLHGRAATSGAVKNESAHPIRVDCNECDFEWVVHNGSIRNWRQQRASMHSIGHQFNTHVDTEIIGHKVGEVPDSTADIPASEYNMSGMLNYLTFSEDGILVHVERKYNLTDDFVMTCSRREFDSATQLGFEINHDNEWMIITPDGDDVDIDTKERERKSSTVGNSRSTTRSSNGTSTHRSGSWNHANGTSYAESGADTDSTTKTIEYTDHMPEYDYISVIKVAPGVVRVENEWEDETEYLFRDKDPKLYFWYSPEPTPDNIEQLEELAEAKVDKGEQTQMSDYTEEKIEKIAAAESADTIKSIINGTHEAES